jgi:hypothetical protein
VQNGRVGARSAVSGLITLCDQSFDALSVATSRLVAKDRDLRSPRRGTHRQAFSGADVPHGGMTGRSPSRAAMHKHTGWLIAPWCYYR